jgi:glycosyltransferase involved in cell wall biosynthesis
MKTPSEHFTLSVVTPVLNAIDTIEATVSSVSELHRNDVEHIIIDGGSTDGTWEYLQSLNGIRLLLQKSKGISAGLNEGLSQARGDFVAILNGDDAFLSAISEVVEILAARPKADTIYYADIIQHDPVTGRSVTREADIGAIALYMSIYHPALFVPRSIYIQVGGYSEEYRLAMDCDFVHRCLARKIRFTRLPFITASMSLRGRSHVDTYGAMREFERSVVSAGLQNKWTARWFRGRQTLFHYLLKYKLVQSLWLELRKILRRTRFASVRT